MKGRDELLVYLDLDGVVHHQAVYQDRRRGIYMSPTEAPDRTLFEWVDTLIDLLRPFPSVRLVLSSSWCRRPGYSRSLKRLPLELRSRFIGGTFHRRYHGLDLGLELAFAELPRGVQVINDVERRQPKDWLALDDDDIGWPAEHRDRLVKCDGRLGLSDPTTQQELTRRLSKMASLGALPDRAIGFLTGGLYVPADFDEPLPREVLEAFEGGAARGLHALAADVFDTAVEAATWLNRPHPLLRGQAPIRHAETAAGEQRVIDMLIAIKHGGVV